MKSYKSANYKIYFLIFWYLTIRFVDIKILRGVLSLLYIFLDSCETLNIISKDVKFSRVKINLCSYRSIKHLMFRKKTF